MVHAHHGLESSVKMGTPFHSNILLFQGPLSILVLGSWSQMMMDFKLELLHEYSPFVVILRLARAAMEFCGSTKINIKLFFKIIAIYI